ncbi:HAMP domain-containing protein [Rhodobacteraceae bacterium 2CG4]|uniref:histidine kinase n=1 Tax=Halovulum marinum TaxID=2662447 RepID=A0A6L5YWU5_9RHOB|nr:HAMP domain-containing protein [Halovulum marinum]
MALIFALGGIAVGVAALAYGRSAAQQSYDRLLIGAATQIADALSVRGGEVVVDLPVSAFELLSLAPDDRIVYAIHDPAGRLLTGYDTLRPPPSQATFFNATFRGEPVRVAHVRRPFAERSFSGVVEVLVGQTTRARARLANQITRNALIAAGIAGLVMSGLAVFAVRSALQPLRRIERDIAGRPPHDLTPVTVAVPREIASLVAALNRFVARLDRQVGVMRNLIADASHQLRTPIAAVRAQAELAADETDPERLRAAVARIHRRSVTLGRLADQLLSHALIIHRADSAALARIDLRTVAIRTLEQTDHDLLGDGIRPHLDLPEDPVWAEGDPLSLVEASKNLVLNALRHGQPPVTLTVRVAAGTACIAVRDAGPGMPAAQWADAGARFARSRGVSADSAGLGLAIVQAVATAHKGRLAFRRTAGGTFEAAIDLPAADRGGA